MQIDVSCPHTKHRLGDIGYNMFVILEPIASGNHIYPYLHLCNLSSLPVKYRSIAYHDVYIMCHVLSSQKRVTVVPASSPDCGKIYIFKTRNPLET